jgi:tetratricopeptide (TPR) repeat protein
VEENPDYLTGHLLLGEGYLYAGFTRDAEECALKGLQKDPNHLGLLRLLEKVKRSTEEEVELNSVQEKLKELDPLCEGIAVSTDEWDYGAEEEIEDADADVEEAVAESSTFEIPSESKDDAAPGGSPFPEDIVDEAELPEITLETAETGEEPLQEDAGKEVEKAASREVSEFEFPEPPQDQNEEQVETAEAEPERKEEAAAISEVQGDIVEAAEAEKADIVAEEEPAEAKEEIPEVRADTEDGLPDLAETEEPAAITPESETAETRETLPVEEPAEESQPKEAPGAAGATSTPIDEDPFGIESHAEEEAGSEEKPAELQAEADRRPAEQADAAELPNEVGEAPAEMVEPEKASQEDASTDEPPDTQKEDSLDPFSLNESEDVKAFEASLNAVLEDIGGDKEIIADLSAVSDEASQPEDSITEDKPTAQAKPKKKIATKTLGELYASQKKYDEAIEIYNTLVENDPKNKQYKKRLEELKSQREAALTENSETKDE